jgi:predicted amidohydrolase
MTNPLRLALLAWPVERTTDLAAKLDHWAALAKQGGADLLLAPEYAVMETVAGAGSPQTELYQACDQADAILATLRATAQRHTIWLAPGSLPMRTETGIHNRAPLIDPDGRLAFQDKRVMTRFEAESWGVTQGEPPAIFQTPWGLIGIAICYDVEFPGLVRAQVEAGAWLVLVPCCTDTMAGFNRVRLSARARALENQCYVAVAPTVGDAPFSATLDSNRGYACAFGPVDRGFPEDGVLARGPLDRPGLTFVELDPARLASTRRHGAVRNHQDWPPPPPPSPTRHPV